MRPWTVAGKIKRPNGEYTITYAARGCITLTVPAGTVLEFEVSVLDKGLIDFVYEALDYGELSGIGQWRNSGKGRFTWDEAEKI